MKAHYFIGKEYSGSADVHPQSRSYCFFCPSCNDIWARVVIDKADGEVRTNACSVHTNISTFTYGQPPGSIIPTMVLEIVEAAGLSPLLIQNLPLSLLQREFNLHLSHVESL
jgi:hypothetical protein